MRYGLIGAAILIALLVLFAMLGCTVGRELDTDAPVIGFRVGDEALVKAASGFGGVVGGLFGGPAGAATGASLAGAVATAFWGIRRGERKGWDEAVETVNGRPALGAGTPAPVSGGVPSSRVGPVA
jgi:hypothetical protein